MNNEKTIPISLLIALIGFPQISETIYTPALPSVAAGLQASAYIVETTLSIYFLGFALGVLIWGTISDYLGRRTAMLAGIFVYGIGTLGCALAQNVEALLAWRFLQAFGASVGSVITQTILRDSYSGTEQTKIFSVLTGAIAFSPALGPILGGFISEFWGWRANFWILVLFAFCLSIFTFSFLPETRPANIVRLSAKKTASLLLQMIGVRTLWGHILLIGATNGILFGFYQEAPFIFIEQLQIAPSFYGLFGLLIATATIVAAKISYQKNHIFSPQAFIQWGALCVLLGAFLFMIFVLFEILNTTVMGMGATILTLFLIFFGVGLIIPNSLSNALKAYKHAAGTAGSIFGGFYYCLIAIFTWLISLLHNGTAWPLPLYFIILGIILIIGSKMVCSKYLDQKPHSAMA